MCFRFVLSRQNPLNRHMEQQKQTNGRKSSFSAYWTPIGPLLKNAVFVYFSHPDASCFFLARGALVSVCCFFVARGVCVCVCALSRACSCLQRTRCFPPAARLPLFRGEKSAYELESRKCSWRDGTQHRQHQQLQQPHSATKATAMKSAHVANASQCNYCSYCS